MGSPPDISVIVVSRDRPSDLRKMLASLRFQDISGFEVIVVTNTPAALENARYPEPLRLFDCNEANISVARNVGLDAAKGRYIAFCDDDALPDPSWLRRLLAPFSDPEIGAAGGFTRGRNGISLQWGAVETDRLGVAHPLDIAPRAEPTIFAPSQDRAPVMIGTNCAFRASALRQIGGFDPAFAYFLDDSDISLRLSLAGWKLAIVPRAQVHHGFAGGPYRQQNRVPKTLAPHGKSQAYFGRKHAPEQALGRALSAFRALQFSRLEKQMLAGLMEPACLKTLMLSLDKGHEAGLKMQISLEPNQPRPDVESSPVFTMTKHRHVMLVGRKSDRKWQKALAATLSKAGVMVTALTLSRSAAYMQVGFAEKGYWVQSGGQMGKSGRHEPLIRVVNLREKVDSEVKRLSGIRPVNYVVYPQQSDAPDIFSPHDTAMSCINGLVVDSF